MKYVYVLIILLNINLKFHSQNFTSSNLPIVIINTNGQLIDSSWYYVVVNMGIIDNGSGNRNNITDPYNNYSGNIQIRLQGSSSIQWPKKSYRITTLNAFFQPADVSLLGMPEHEDWILKALYQDKSFLRDELAFRIYNQMGNYASRSRFVEVVVDGNYRGVYQLLEKIKKDKNRVNISTLKDTEISGNDLTGGYIISLDKFTTGDQGWYSKYKSNGTQDSANYFLYYYPKPDSMPQVQKDYIKNYFDQFEDVLVSPGFNHPTTGFRNYINVLSFIDNFIINEISRNADGYRASTFFTKNKESTGDGKLRAGPIWDFNIAWGNCSYLGGNNPYWWQYQQYPTINFVPFWWWQFMADSSFKNDLKCRYKILRENILNETVLFQYIDNMTAYLEESQQRNYTKWPILGQVIYPNPSPAPATYAEEISYLKFWLHERLIWLDQNLPGPPCIVSLPDKLNFDNYVHVFPNPFANTLNVSYSISGNTSVKIELISIIGDKVIELYSNKTTGTYNEQIDQGAFPSGTYILKMTLNGIEYNRKIIKID